MNIYKDKQMWRERRTRREEDGDSIGKRGGNNLGTSIRATRANELRCGMPSCPKSTLVISEAYLIKWAGPGHYRSYSRLLAVLTGSSEAGEPPREQ